MKRLVVKSAFAISCIVAASVSGFKAYEQNNKNEAAVKLLLTENVEALSEPDAGLFKFAAKYGPKVCGWLGAVWTCYEIADAIWGSHGEWRTKTYDTSTYNPNGTKKEQHYTIVRSCERVDGWGTDQCHPGQIETIQI